MTFTSLHRASDNLSKGAQATLLALILLAFGLRVTGLHQNSFWMDEIFQVAAAQQPIPGIIDSVKLGGDPPGYYILLHFWLPFTGNSEFAIRLLAVAAGTLAVLVTYALATRMLGRSVGLASAFLLALSPQSIYYSQENRAYALLALLGLMTMYFAHGAVRSGHLRHWGGFVASAVLGLYMHYFSGLAIGMASVFVTFFLVRNSMRRREEDHLLASHRTLLAFAVCLVLIALCYTPWLPGIQAQYARRGGLPYALPVSPEFFRRIMFFAVGGGWGLVALSLAAIAYELVLGKREMGFISLLLAVVAAVIAAFAINHIVPIVTERNMIVVLPVFLLLVTAGLVRMGEHLLQLAERSRLKTVFREGRRRGALSVLPVLFLAAISLPATAGVYTISKADWRGATSYLTRTVREGDVVLVAQWPADLWYYLERRDADLLVLDALNLENGLVDQAPDLDRPVGAWWVLFCWAPWSAQDLASVLGQDFTVDTSFFELAIIHHEHVTSRDELLLYSAEVLEAIASIKPDYPFQPLVEAANLYTAAGREDLAIEIYLRAGEENTRSPSLHLKLGEYYMESGNTEGALHEFERTVELEGIGSLAFQAAMHLGGYYRSQGEIEKAATWYTTAAEVMAPWASMAHSALGRMYHQEGRLEEALQAYGQAITQPEDPEIVTYYHEMAQIYEEMERPDDAVQAYQAALGVRPHHPLPHLKLGEYYMESGNTEGALHEFERTVELEGVGSLAFQAAMYLGEYYTGQEAYDEAADWFTTAAERMPAWASIANVALARMYRGQGRLEEAIEAYLAAVSQPEDPEVPTYYYELGQLYEARQQLAAAVYAYREVLKYRPEDSAAQERLKALSSPLAEFKGYPEELQEIAIAHFAATGDFLMAWNGTVSSPPELLNPGVYILQVEAHGQPGLGENPEMTVKVSITDNGGERRVIAEDAFSVSEQTSVYTSSRFELASQAIVVVSLSFTNDYGAPDGDRNLFIRRVWIAYEPSD